MCYSLKINTFQTLKAHQRISIEMYYHSKKQCVHFMPKKTGHENYMCTSDTIDRKKMMHSRSF